MKHDKIRIKDTVSGAKTLKIIDFDNGFIEGEYPDVLGGDQNYMAPEAFIRMSQDEEGAVDKIAITPKADIFSLGIIFHEILTGTLPQSSNPEIQYMGLAVGYGEQVILNESLPLEYADLITKMICQNPEQRPSALDVFEMLKNKIDPLSLSDGR
jgi:serine/threonine protein kinase